MAVKKTKRTLAHKMIDDSTEDLLPPPIVQAETAPKSGGNKSYLWGGLIVLALIGFLLFRKGYIVVALVNGKPIFRWDVTGTLYARFGKQTIEGMVSEALIADAAAKAGVAITKEEIDAREQEILKSLGPNVNLDELLKFQGMTRTDFDNQVRLQLMVSKVLEKDVVVTEKDIADYIASNSGTLVATDEAKMKIEARAGVVNQKVSERIQPWFLELKQKANIVNFVQ